MRRFFPPIRPGRPGELATALALVAVGAAGALSAGGAPDPIAFLIWIALVAPCAGALAAASGMHVALSAPVAPAGWAFTLAIVDGLAEADLATPIWSAAAWTGLFAAGFGLVRALPARPGRGMACAAALLVLAAVLASLPVGGGLLGTQSSDVPVSVRARLFDVSPASLLVECAGVDWMRHPSVYERARTSDFDPASRAAYRGFLAGPLVLLVGCFVAVWGEILARRRREG